MNEIGSYERRFGNIAIDKGFITTNQLVEALNLQVMEESRDGSHRLTGEVLFDLEYITAEQIEDVLSELRMIGGK
jgi:hypothetical protein